MCNPRGESHKNPQPDRKILVVNRLVLCNAQQH
jgi:hypothetical protein